MKEEEKEAWGVDVVRVEVGVLLIILYLLTSDVPTAFYSNNEKQTKSK